MKQSRLVTFLNLFAFLFPGLLVSTAQGQEEGGTPPAPPSNLVVADHPMDGGEKIDLIWELSPDKEDMVASYTVWRSRSAEEIEDEIETRKQKYITKKKNEASENVLGADWRKLIPDLTPEQRGVVKDARQKAAELAERDFTVDENSDDILFLSLDALPLGSTKYTANNLKSDESYLFMVTAMGHDFSQSEGAKTTTAISPTMQWVDGTWTASGGRRWLSIILLIFCGSVLLWILIARSGKPIKVRKIAGLEAIDEAVGRATEMGRSILYVPGIQDMNDIQTIASMTVLSHVSKTAAEYDAKIEVPTARSLVMTVARETVQASYLAAGKPDAYNQDLIYYVTNEQFGYVAYLSGMMVREKPAACFYMGAFFAESLILAETGNHIGAIQIAGTAMPAQLPFFVAACDYTLIGEEYFAASAYLSGSPEDLGSLKGQDMCKIMVAVLMLIGVSMLTLASMMGSESAMGTRFETWTEFLKNVILT